MCILTLYVNDGAKQDEYQLILAANRDEFYDRPAQQADFWHDQTNCIGGLDLEKGLEGGTWCAMNASQAKIGLLLNILNSTGRDSSKKGRGFLVRDYLTSSISAQDYMSKLADHRSEYNPFNLVLLEKKESKWTVNYFSTNDDDSPKILNGDILAFGNSSIRTPWKKVDHVRNEFKEIISRYRNKEHINMREEAVKVMCDTTQYWPDSVLQNQTGGRFTDEMLQMISAPSYILGAHYGTRTNTVILIRGDGHVEYFERTMKAPVVVDNPQWTTTSHTFQLGATFS